MEPQPINVTSALAGPRSLGEGGTEASIPVTFAHALFHHGATLDCVGVFVRDEDAVFVVLVARDYVGVAGDAGEDARGDTALGDLVALVGFVVGGAV